MQTPAERYLIQKITDILNADNDSDLKRILNIGAGKSLVIESSLIDASHKFICDRIDIIDCTVKHPSIGKCFIASVEAMPELESESYLLAFGNYTLEHVLDLDKASKEISRVLKPDGFLILSLPNPSAPEFILSKHTPLWFHRFFRGRDVYHTYYAYKNIQNLVNVLIANGFTVVEIKYFSFILGYLYRFPIIDLIGNAYDNIVDYLNLKNLMGNVCLVVKKQRDK